MSVLCKFGWHAWEAIDVVRILPMPPGFQWDEGRECERCGKTQVHRPGLHHPPYWKDLPE